MIVKVHISEDSRCLLKPRNEVSFGDLFLEKKTNLETEVFISRDLKISPKNIFRFLKKLVGDQVKKEEAIAIKKDFFGKKIVTSQVNGIIKIIDHNSGKIIISDDEKFKTTTKAFFKGEVIDIRKNYLELKLEKAEQFELTSSSSNFGGQTYYFEQSDIYGLTSSKIENRIIISKSFNALIQAKIEAIGALGLVSLTRLDERHGIGTAQIKNIADFKKITSIKFPYCLIDKQSSRIYFYI